MGSAGQCCALVAVQCLLCNACWMQGGVLGGDPASIACARASWAAGSAFRAAEAMAQHCGQLLRRDAHRTQAFWWRVSCLASPLRSDPAVAAHAAHAACAVGLPTTAREGLASRCSKCSREERPAAADSGWPFVHSCAAYPCMCSQRWACPAGASILPEPSVLQRASKPKPLSGHGSRGSFRGRAKLSRWRSEATTHA